MGVCYDSRLKSFYVRLQVNGKRRVLYVDKDGNPFKNRTDAKMAESEFRKKVVSETTKPSGEPIKKELHCEDLYQAFYDSLKQTLKTSSLYVREKHFEHHVRQYFDGRLVKSITNEDLEEINTRMNKEKSDASMENIVATARKWVIFIQKYNPVLLPNKFFEFKNSDPEIHKYHVWTREEEARFLSGIDKPSIKLLFTMLVDYGFRITECLALRYDDIDFEKNTISVNRIVCFKTLDGGQVFMAPKTKNSRRTLPLLSEVRSQLNPQGQGYVFPGEGSPVVGQTNIRRYSIKYAKKAKLKPLKLHEFRHSCASNMLRAGLPVRVVAQWLGDTESTVMTYYSHLFEDEKNMASKWLEANKLFK